MALTGCPECKHENSDKAAHCAKCGHPFKMTNNETGLWAAVTKAKTPINVFALAMMACAAVFGYSATKVESAEALRAFTYSLHTFLAVVGMFFLTLLFCRSAIYHPNELSKQSDSQMGVGHDKPGLAAGLICLLCLAYGMYQVYATWSQ